MQSKNAQILRLEADLKQAQDKMALNTTTSDDPHRNIALPGKENDRAELIEKINTLEKQIE